LFVKDKNRNCLLLFSKVSKLIPKIIGHPKTTLLYIVKIHEKYIQRCIQLAKTAWAQPTQPMVGSVIVYENRIIGKAGKKSENRMPK
jgi:diaminohydroxyphosphoribosylaminopyrimidine deaminase/5-amino-6-(5-phosphoribosylamino)uracil reductase